MRTSVGVFAVVAALLSAQASAQPIERIRPSDGIASIRIEANVRETKINVTFVEDMIPLGGGHGEFPVKLEGPGSCNWGWRGPRTVSCLLGLNDRLPLAQRYTLVLEDGLSTISGNPVPAFRLDFETDRPTARFTNIDWQGPTSPLVYVHTNVPVSARELQRRIRLEPLGGATSPVNVEVSRDPDPVEYLSTDLQFMLKPDSDLAPDTAYVIRVADGLAGIDSGLAGIAHNAGAFRTHAAYEFLGIGCGPHADRSYWENEKPLKIPLQPDCAPEQPVAMLFSAEPETRGLYRILTDAALAPEIARTLEVSTIMFERPRATHYQATKVIYALRLRGFPAGKTNAITLPATLVDRFGRKLKPTTAEFTTRNYVPAFIDQPMLDVVASGSGDVIEYATVNTDAIAARFHKDELPDIVSLSLETESPGINRPGKAVLDVEEELGKPWGVLFGEVAITHRALVNKRKLRGFPVQYAPSVGAILSPWDVVVAAKGLGLTQRHSIWVSDLESGDAVTGATVELLEHPRNRGDSNLATAYRTGNVVGTARTDKSGFAEIFPSANTSTTGYPSLVRVTKGDTVVVLPFEIYQFAHNGFEVPVYRRNTRFPNVGYFGEGAVITWGVTDKPLYRSGETVRVKAYVRNRDDNRLVIPAKKSGWKLHCVAYPNDLCAGRTVDLDEYGAFEATIELPESVLDGEYRISAQSEVGGMAALSFRVASYKPKPHRVQAEIATDLVIGDEPIPVRASTEYFAGGALRNARAQVIVETRSDTPPVPAPLLHKYYFGNDRQYGQRSFRSEADAEFDNRGQLTGSFELPRNSPARGTATVTVGALHDGGEWAFSDPATIEYVQRPFILGLSDDEQSIVAGEPYQAGVMLIDLKGEGGADLTVVQALEYPVHRYKDKTQVPRDTGNECTVSIAPDSPTSCELIPTRVGLAVIRAELMRGEEKLLTVDRQVYVAPTKQRWWYIRKSDRLDIELEVDQLEAGQAAEIVVDVPYDRASVLFALNRNNVFDQWREVLPRGPNTIRIPLTEKHAPGFTFTAIARPVGPGSGTSIGEVPVKVRSIEIPATLSIKTDSQEYETGDEVRLTVNSSAAGKTQLAVAVIDEAVLDLVPNVDELFDPRGEGFEGLLELWGSFRWWQLSRVMGVRGSTDRGTDESSVMAGSGAYDRSSVSNSMALAASAEPAGATDGLGGPSLRHDFAEAAYFNPSVMTSENGDAEITFTVPDNLGKWRLVVIGTDVQGRIFMSTGQFHVSLPLEVRADLPTRLIAGDSIRPSASVLNRKAAASEVTLSLAIDANGSRATDTRTERLGSMESLSASAFVDAVTGAELRLTATAADGEDSDGLRITAPIMDPVESRSWTSIAPLSANASVNQPVELPVNALKESAELRVVLDKSVVGDPSQTFHYMSQDGHRSWEQILSRAVVAAYAGSWDVAGANRPSADEMRNRLLQGSNFQTASGGMSHFEPREDLANDYLSAYTLLALGWVEKQGFDVPAYQQRLARFVFQRVNHGLRDRRSSYRMVSRPSDRDMPVMLAALTSNNPGGDHLNEKFSRYLRAHADDYDVDELAYALIAATNIDASGELRSTLSDRLQARLVETFDRTEISGGEYRFGNRNELYCMVLSALQQAREFAPDSRALTKLVRGGYEFRDQDSGFGNTHANAVCIVALTQFRDEFEAPSEALSAMVVADDVERFSVMLGESVTTQTSEAVTLPTANRRSEVTVSLTEGSAGYASTNIRYDVDLSREVERSHGYTIQRAYSVYRRNEWQRIKSGISIRQGDWVRIDLDIVSPVVRGFVAITDPTPAGLEPIDPSLASPIPGDAQRRARWRDSFNQIALSNEQSRFYAEWLSAGSHTVTYYAQAKFAGEFMALPAKVESMYSDGVFATTKPEVLRIESRMQRGQTISQEDLD